MATITEDYISFETAKLLKEKGFDEHCFCINYPLPEGGHRNIILQNLLNNSMIPFTDEYKFCRYKEDFITIPTLQMAMKWLREEQNLFIEIQCYGCESDEKAHFEYSYVISEYVQINNNICTTVGLEQKKAKSRFHTYEEAVEAAVKYCLENLI